VYLRPNVAPKPLLYHWPLWPQLVPPAWASMIVAKTHVPTMESYVAAPETHAAALRDPKLAGGPWIGYAPLVDEIRELLRATKQVQQPMLAFAKALQDLDDLMRRSAKGSSLEPMYPAVPAALRGLVELVYDPNNHPSVRVLEGLAYRSEAYQRDLQQIALQLVGQDSLPYERSTPVLDDGSVVFTRMAFADPRLDWLFEREQQMCALDEVAERLGIARDERLAALFATTAPVRRHVAPAPGDVRLRYMGHASVLVETRGVSILTDPFLSYEYPAEPARYTIQDLPDRIDYVLITHAHNDHLRPETLLRLRHRIGTIVVPRAGGRRIQDPSLKLIAQQLGFSRVIELHELESVDVPGGSITAVPFLGEHSDMDIQGKTGYRVALDGRTALFLADSCNIDDAMYRRLGDVVAAPDAVFIGMECEGSPLSWYYGAMLTQKIDRAMDQARRDRGSNCAQAESLVHQIRPKRAYVYAMGQEPWLNHVLAINQAGDHLGIRESDQFVASCRAQGIESERLYGRKDIAL
jgi:L-ascorbate metabolism protein UlaG (beta-lactamase superfamily)